MAKKSSRKASDDAQDSTSQEDVSAIDSAEDANVAVVEETAAPKAKTKVSDDGGANGSVGISDIRKAVAFVNSVGGLDKALGLLQILKVAREVQ